MDGEGRAIIKNNLATCVKALTIDFNSQSLFWVDNCNSRLESVRVDGQETSDFSRVQLVGSIFSGGISIFGNYLYWTESGIQGSIKILDRITGGPVVQVSTVLRGVVGGIEVVHPKMQPDST